MEGGEQTGACPWWEGVGGEESCPPRKYALFHLYFTNEIKGGGSSYMQNEGGGRTGACPW